ncbi:MAG: 50S ribosomal protein L28 [Candidatus Buchananbacteria bacterium RIFCSPHIGHO2_01_FULL_39_14]|uniref:Large ribosomal subunit protein bL28 n=2 Tax=Candidatus Buchananiibacteriota TaxID=1817903 RepID=A0A1G1YM31_9BACT|nr:MAG: 50S ribosomal protein L28 [Candidatus Buchananbacteria bacterium RIFCSPHIGHO2_01_FULL_39_14]OGY49347.1 MAG: 50S ribosomal protein L28 [Candidatus Buchananbacteria bacterium RIFCSPHIGHO2_02_FULL_39_17]OGY53341.1 MAG: 50S ribosomal protein L28 [Candidatus Buchananbacteria bacterium RIFCSPLOWO2_01_FULL_40_23b]
MLTCEICGRSPLKANWRSHSNQKTIRRQKLNLQTKKINGKRMVICTSCLKTLLKAPRKKSNKKTK